MKWASGAWATAYLACVVGALRRMPEVRATTRQLSLFSTTKRTVATVAVTEGEAKPKKKNKKKPTSSEVCSHFSNRLSFGDSPGFKVGGTNFTIFGEPVALQRHRMTRFNIMYNPSAPLQAAFLSACTPFLPLAPLQGPIAVKLDFHMPRLRMHYGTGKKANVLRPDAAVWHTKKPDIDNLAKFVLDALNGHAFVDDCQVVSLIVSKAYVDVDPRVCVTLLPMDSDLSATDAQARLLELSAGALAPPFGAPPPLPTQPDQP